MRLTILSLIARLFGIQFRVDGVRYGANAARPAVPSVTIRSPRSVTTGSDNVFIGHYPLEPGVVTTSGFVRADNVGGQAFRTF